MKKIDDAIELLECAKINCDNVKVLGTYFAAAVKYQITEAIKLLEAPDGE